MGDIVDRKVYPRTNKFDIGVQQEQKKIDAQPDNQEVATYNRKVDASKRRKSRKSTNILSRLEEIDNEQD